VVWSCSCSSRNSTCAAAAAAPSTQHGVCQGTLLRWPKDTCQLLKPPKATLLHCTSRTPCFLQL
jgi:hypothetical protein